MKKTILSICLLGLILSLPAQDKVFRNSLSLNFASSFRNLGLTFPIQPPGLVFPGIEYRYEYGERLSLRAGLDYLPLMSFRMENPAFAAVSQTNVQGLSLSSGLQYRLWGDDFSKDFRFYALADLILGRQWVEREASFQVAMNLVETHNEWLNMHASLGWGLGIEYLPIDRLSIRLETAFSIGLFKQQLIDRMEDDTTELGFFPQDDGIRFLVNTSLLTELSIGWRF